MFVRTVETKSGGRTHRYLRVVENYRDNGKLKQRVLWNLGNLEKVRRKLPGLLRSLGNQAGEQLVSLRKLRSERVREYGNILLLRTMWAELGLDECIGTGRTAGRMRPFIMAAVFHRLLHPDGQPHLAEWLGGVCLPEMDRYLRYGRVRIDKKISGALEYLARDGKNQTLRLIPKTGRKGSAPVLYITRLKMNVPGVHGSILRQKEALLAILMTGGRPGACGIYYGKSPLSFIGDVLADEAFRRGAKGRGTVLAADRSVIGDTVINFLNREKIPYAAFLSRWGKRGAGRPRYKAGRGYVAQRIRTAGRKGPRVYVISRKTARSRTKGRVICAFKTNVTDRAFPARAVRAHKEHSLVRDFFGDIALPAGVSSGAEHREGYVLICVLAYLLARALDEGLSRAGSAGRRLTYRRLLDMLRDVRLVTNTVSGKRLNCVTKIPRKTRELMRIFGVRRPGSAIHTQAGTGGRA